MSTVTEIEARGTLTFHQALVQAVAQARSTLDVALHERLSAAVALVKTGRTFQSNDGTWQVESTSQAGRVYSVNGVCACSDHHFNHPPQGLCKHRIGHVPCPAHHDPDAPAPRAGGARAGRALAGQ